MKKGYAIPKGWKQQVNADLTLRPDQRHKILATAALIIRCGVATGNIYSNDDVAPDNAPCDSRMLRAIDDSGVAVEYLNEHFRLVRTRHYQHVNGNYTQSYAYRYSFINCPEICFRSCYKFNNVWRLLEKAENTREQIDKRARGVEALGETTNALTWEHECAKHLHIQIDPRWSKYEKLRALDFNMRDYRVSDLRAQNGRVYTSITQLPKTVRNNLRFGSRQLATIDISSAFLTFAAILTSKLGALDDLLHLKHAIRSFFERHDMAYTEQDLKEFRQRMVMDSLQGIKAKFYKFLSKMGLGKLVDMLEEFHNRCRIRAKALKTKNACVIEKTLGKIEAQYFDALMKWAEEYGIVMFRIHDCVMVLRDDLNMVHGHMMGLGQALWGIDIGLESAQHVKSYPTISVSMHHKKEFMKNYISFSISHYVGEWWMYASLQQLDRNRRRHEIIASRRRSCAFA
ncbi:hypothetical protein [Gemmatimonas groenlandica]|uniref:Uncharacterized protein n=1 Tax=Gemmatimonas groenlandica TaxID=2732249 RepID=A0A6M4IQW3_9BACT|nr:hypothetical protein [Gemmatimonas groenlandica]QJR35232.1 hypothetical protein HKW67_06805 [Gemmatimonas groenlandica]